MTRKSPTRTNRKQITRRVMCVCGWGSVALLGMRIRTWQALLLSCYTGMGLESSLSKCLKPYPSSLLDRLCNTPTCPMVELCWPSMIGL